ncbi:hypothetical protein GUJ93_ZPchr0011g27286 [Zizania palustris]|uniref:Bromo domain-containing protein n=1 Tax=Zizania palustris TaxID=103762 RepID=A0A8J5WMI1_ZIZPA|nr:hypothetical protein GUJ93_ZPchr0011g27286 [Zizania palustris]
MSGKGKRRSARLLKLEEQKNDDTTATARLLDPWQIIRNSITGARGKRKRNEEIQGEASSSQALDATTNSNNVSSKSSAVEIIEYILDTLEMRDKHELFAMPDDIQVSDYAERVNRPGDFATLRQKNKDGMYNTLEQFENDVYMVFQKAMSINSQDTIPYREAMSLLHQAKQVFMSLKSNQMYSESELTAWRQKHAVGRPLAKPTTTDGKGDGSIGGSGAATAAAPRPTPQRPNAPARKKSAACGGVADRSTPRQRGAREGSATPARRARKAAASSSAAAAAAEPGGAGAEQRRLTYTAGGHGRLMVPVVSQGQHATLIYQPQPQGHTYQDSLRRFVRHAGLKARVAAEFRSLECDMRARQSPTPPASRSNGFASSSGTATRFLPHGYCLPPLPLPPSAAIPASRAPPPGVRVAADAGEQSPPRCKLETDEVLKLLVTVGRPAFAERARRGPSPGGDKREESSSKEGHHDKRVIRATGDDAKASVVRAAKPSGKKESASKPAAVDFGPFAPPRLVVPGRLGFSQFAGSSAQPFKVKPSTPDTPKKKKRGCTKQAALHD